MQKQIRKNSITVLPKGSKISFCNIYVPNNHLEQLEFTQELNNCLIDKSEASCQIIDGDWNCTLSNKDKKGKLPSEKYRISVYAFDYHGNIRLNRYTKKAPTKFEYSFLRF